VQKQLLIVEDDAFVRDMMRMALKSQFDIVEAENGREGIMLLDKGLNPAVIVSDIEMPELDGYEFCKKVRDFPHLIHVPIVFVSSRGTLEERIRGYEVGANDFLVKPFATEELSAKLEKLISIQSHHSEIEKKYQSAQKAASTAISSNSEFGKGMSAVEAIVHSNSLVELAHNFQDFCSSLGLNTSLIIEMDHEVHFFGNEGPKALLEKQIIEMLRNKGRFYDFDNRTQINYDKISLLVKNMPKKDRDRYGRYKDLLPSVIEAAESRVTTLTLQRSLRGQLEELQEAVIQINSMMTKLLYALANNKDKAETTLDSLIMELETSFLTMGLDDDQEAYLKELIDQKVHVALESTQNLDEVTESFTEVAKSLMSMVLKQQDLLQSDFFEKVTSTSVSEQEPQQEDDVTLF